jgi:predicted O-methyltransferase YrrM
MGRWVLKRLGLYSLWSLRRTGPLREDGWFRSFEERMPVDAAGAPIPWMTYPAIALLCERVRPDMVVFEYGAGMGTLWWASRVREVVVCEHDEAWVREVRPRLPSHVTLLHVPLEYGGEYSRAVARYPGRFDVVVIDGRDRVHCAANAVVALKPGGVIVWDNSDRSAYASGIESLRGAGFRVLRFPGLAPVESHRTETAILYRPDNCFGI